LLLSWQSPSKAETLRLGQPQLFGACMTTIVVVKKDGVAVIAADSLTTFGSTRLASVHDAAPEKILKHGDTFFGISGSAAHQLVLESLLQSSEKLKGCSFNGRAQIYDSFRKLHPILKDEAFLNPKDDDDDPYESSQLTSLLINPSGIFGVYSMREVFEFDRFWAIGSGRDFALGAMYAIYDSRKTAEEIARMGVTAGAAYDTGTALPMHVFTAKLAKPKTTAKGR
jgi:ATP-dependent HslUV protease subunit HslV